MRKITLLLFTIVLFSSSVFAETQQKFALEDFILVNFINPNCHEFFGKPISSKYNLIQLDERFVNRVGSIYAPTSCKGETCWSWTIASNIYDWRVLTSNIPISIKNSKKLAESISQTIKESQNLRKSASSLVSAAQEFINSNFGTSKDKNITKERSMSLSEIHEQATETNLTASFHDFIAKGLQGTLPAPRYAFCISSAVDLVYRAYFSDRLDDLVQSYILYRTVKPEDLDFSSQNTVLNRAKLIYSIAKSPSSNLNARQYEWAHAVLFAKLLDWDELKEPRQLLDNEIKKIHENYALMQQKSTQELSQINKNLALQKFNKDKELKLDAETAKQKQNEIRDAYIHAAALSRIIQKPSQDDLKELEQAIAKQDPFVTQKFVQVSSIAVFPKWPVLGLLGIAVIVTGIIIFKKRRKNMRKILLLFFLLIFLVLNAVSNALANDDLYFLATKEMKAGNFQNAISYFSELIDVESSQPGRYTAGRHIYRGDCYFYMKEYQKAMQDYQTERKILKELIPTIAGKHNLGDFLDLVESRIKNFEQNKKFYERNETFIKDFFEYQKNPVCYGNLHTLNETETFSLSSDNSFFVSYYRQKPDQIISVKLPLFFYKENSQSVTADYDLQANSIERKTTTQLQSSKLQLDFNISLFNRLKQIIQLLPETADKIQREKTKNFLALCYLNHLYNGKPNFLKNLISSLQKERKKK